MPDKPILVSKRDFLEQVLNRSHNSSFVSDDIRDNSLSQPRLPQLRQNATISLLQEEQMRLSRDLGPLLKQPVSPNIKHPQKPRKTPKLLYDQHSAPKKNANAHSKRDRRSKPTSPQA